MGPSEVQKLILGKWVNIVGHDHDHRHHHHDDDGRGQYGQQPWQQPPQQYPLYQQPYYQQPYQHPPYQQYRPHPGRTGQARVTASVRPNYGQNYGQPNPFGGLVHGIESILGEPSVGYQIPPRNALVQDPAPDRAGREVLPMSTGVAILPTQSAQITARPQRVAFRPERVFISAAGTSGGAADWVVNDIKIGNRSQFSQSGDVPGDMFATNAIDGFVSFETAQTAMDVVMVVTYIGLNESGVPFFASIVGTAAI
jgi:hypothetical protein